MPIGLEVLASAGAIAFAARAIRSGKTRAAIKTAISNKFKQATDAVVEQVIQHGVRMNDGGRTVQEKIKHWPRDSQGRFLPRAHLTQPLNPTWRITLADFPVMPVGFHQDSPESRFWFDVEIEIPELGKWLITKVGFATVPDPWDIYQAALQEQLRRIRKSPNRFGLSPDSLSNTELIQIIAVGRTF